jgi:hypothetical protein
MNESLLNHSSSKTVTVLCSGFGLGFYIPGILIRNKCRYLGIEAKSEVFENLIAEEKLKAIDRSRRAYHDDFKVALASQRVPSDIRDSIDPALVDSHLTRWQAEDRRHFICLSGHWVHVLDQYRQRRPQVQIHVDLLHVDAEDSPSWKQLRKLVSDYAIPYRVVQLYDLARRQINYSIDTHSGSALPFGDRNGRLVLHGGGWGIGTYQDKVRELEGAGFDLDIVNYECSAAESDVIGHRRYYLEDPLWRTWHLDEDGNCDFPPPGILRSGEEKTLVTTRSGYHSLHEVVRNATAIVSKPGAGTLIDSLGSCTPLVMLEPFGAHEEANARVWAAAGFGVYYREWEAAGYPVSVLQSMHCTLMEGRERMRDYTSAFVEDIMQEVTQ